MGEAATCYMTQKGTSRIYGALCYQLRGKLITYKTINNNNNKYLIKHKADNCLVIFNLFGYSIISRHLIITLAKPYELNNFENSVGLQKAKSWSLCSQGQNFPCTMIPLQEWALSYKGYWYNNTMLYRWRGGECFYEFLFISILEFWTIKCCIH